MTDATATFGPQTPGELVGFLIIVLGTWLIASATVGLLAGIIAVTVIGPRDRGRAIASALVSGIGVAFVLASGVASIASVALVGLVAALATALFSRYVSLSEPPAGEAIAAAPTADAGGTIASLRQRIRRERGGP